MRSLDELNMNEGGEKVARPTPTSADISRLENEFSINLPEAYIEFLNHSNGGSPELSSVVPDGRDENMRRGINHFYHVSDRDNEEGSIWKEARRWRGILGKNYLPFAEDGGGNPFMFDFSVDPPAIVQCIHDDELHILAISRDFESFVDKLETDPDMI